MKKEKTVRTYKRRTKSGKVVVVRQHTAKYDAAERAKELAKKEGSGEELDAKKKKRPWNLSMEEYLEDLKKRRAEAREQLEEKPKEKPVKEPKQKTSKKTPKSSTSEPSFTADDYKAWYHWDQDADPKNKAALKVEKALKKQMGTKAYNKYFDEMSDNYSARGHSKAFKGLDSFLVSKEDSKTQRSEANKISRKAASLEEKLKQAKYAHSGLRRDDPKKLKYAEKIQKLQKDLADTKKASESQERILDEIKTPKSKEDDWKSAPKNSGKYLAGKQKAGAEKEGLIYPKGSKNKDSEDNIKRKGETSKTPRRGSKAAYEAAQEAKASLTNYVNASPYKRILKGMNTYGGQVNKNELIGKLVKKGLSHAEASKIAGQFSTKVKTAFTKSRQYRPGLK